MTKYLTPEGLKKLKEELDYLKNVERKKVAEKLKHAAAFGDLSENAAYDEAKEAQGFLEGRISELRDVISQAKIIEKKGTEKVQIGSSVLVSSDGKEKRFRIVGSEEVDILKGKISYQSPLGKALLNKNRGDKVGVDVPEGKIEYKIIAIE